MHIVLYNVCKIPVLSRQLLTILRFSRRFHVSQYPPLHVCAADSFLAVSASPFMRYINLGWHWHWHRHWKIQIYNALVIWRSLDNFMSIGWPQWPVFEITTLVVFAWRCLFSPILESFWGFWPPKCSQILSRPPNTHLYPEIRVLTYRLQTLGNCLSVGLKTGYSSVRMAGYASDRRWLKAHCINGPYFLTYFIHVYNWCFPTNK